MVHTVMDSEPDPFGRALRDHRRGERDAPLVDRDGAARREHTIEEWYFGEHDPDAWRDQWIEGPVVDLGGGAGRDALYYQRSFETVAIDVSPGAVETMRDRGVRDARRADMFALPDRFDRDRFRSAAVGTPWTVVGVSRGDVQWRAALAKGDAP